MIQKKSSYFDLAQAIRSGQVSPAQIAEHMKDVVFWAWYKKRFSN